MGGTERETPRGLAVYFKGEWDMKFPKENTEPDTFYLHDGEDVRTDMMTVSDLFWYARTAEVEAVRLPYEGRHTSMLIILPRDRDGIHRLEDRLTIEWLDGLLAMGQVCDGTVTIPKFKFRSLCSVEKAMEGLGAGIALRPGADFTGMTTDEPLWILAAGHQAEIEVDEEGTVASAMTWFAPGNNGDEHEEPPPFTFVADHPFLFLIIERRSGMILFMGRVMDPREG